MAHLCERPGCSAPASVAYGFEAERTMVWLEPLTPENADSSRVGGLCRRHADSLTPPRGWWLDDRRIALPRLFSVPDDPGPAPESTGPADPEAPAESHASQATPRRRQRKAKRMGDDHTSELPFVEGARDPGEESASPVLPDIAPSPDQSAGLDPEETTALPWTPSFDRTDDLGGVLAARSPLLARAFGVMRPT